MANETNVTIRGYVGAAPMVFTNTADQETGEVTETKTTVIRVGVTSRYYSRVDQNLRMAHRLVFGTYLRCVSCQCCPQCFQG